MNYLEFRKLMFWMFETDTMYLKKLLKKGLKFYRRNRLKCSEFCNGHCAYECPNIEVQRFEDWYDLPAAEIGLYETSCRNCRFYDRYMTCSDCYFQFDKLCKYHGNFDKRKGES